MPDIQIAAIVAAVIAVCAWLVYTLLVPVRNALIRWLDVDGSGKVEPDETGPLHTGPLSKVDPAELAASWLATSEGAAVAARIAEEHRDDPKAMLLATIEALRSHRAQSPWLAAIAALAITLSACASPLLLTIRADVDGRASVSATLDAYPVPLEVSADGSGSAELVWAVGTLDAELTADAGVCAVATLGPWTLMADTCAESE